MFKYFFPDPVPNMSIAVARAQAGSRYLDETFGPEWHQRIDRDKLNIASPLNCILGQLLWGASWNECAKIGFVPIRRCIDSGFSCGLWDFVYFLHLPWISRSFHRLNEAWQLVLEERMTQDTLPKPRPATVGEIRSGRDDTGQNRFSCVN